jgi:elongation factor Ts
MVEIDAKTVMALRKRTGAPMMDCKAALQEAGGDMDAAVDVLRMKGLKSADMKASRDASEGLVFSYVHHNGKIGVLAEIACETDFVAKNEEFRRFGHDLCLHIAAFGPRFLSKEDVDPATSNKEREILIGQAREQMAGKPRDVIDKAVDGRMQKFYEEQCLLEQPWVHDDGQTVEQVRKALVGRIGENIQIQRFARFQLGS